MCAARDTRTQERCEMRTTSWSQNLRPKKKRPFKRRWHTWENDIKMDLEEIDREGW